MACHAREAEDQVATQAAELERLWKGATEGAAQGPGGSATALAQLQNETLGGPAEPSHENITLPLNDDALMAEPSPENVPLPLNNDTPMAEPARRVTQFDVSGLMARWRGRAALLDKIDESSGADVPAPPSYPQGMQSETIQARATDTPATDVEVKRAIVDNLNEMLEGDVEQRAAGEHDAQEQTRWERECALLEIEHSALVENTRIESEERVAQEQALALAQLQSQVAEQTTDSAQCESNTATAVLSRPITHFDARSVITGWHQQGSVLGNDEAQPPWDTHKRTSAGHQRVKPAKIQKS
ncbi:hypothetical protein FQN50_006461 [Emmonsiellopsis sp. PD_5]|nr:hypothetical protein FQN50_006461 [Emmonsiellopsis sp. PD_5]